MTAEFCSLKVRQMCFCVFRAAVATGIKERKETRYAWFAAELKLRHLSVTLHPPTSLLSLANEFVCTFFDMMRM